MFCTDLLRFAPSPPSHFPFSTGRNKLPISDKHRQKPTNIQPLTFEKFTDARPTQIRPSDTFVHGTARCIGLQNDHQYTNKIGYDKVFFTSSSFVANPITTDDDLFLTNYYKTEANTASDQYLYCVRSTRYQMFRPSS